MAMDFFNAFNQLIGNLDSFRVKFWKIHVILILQSTTKGFVSRFSTKSCLLTMNSFSTSRWPWNKIRNILANSQRSPYSYKDPIVSEKTVSTLKFVGLKLEKNCWVWSTTIKNFWYCFFTNSADRAEILPRVQASEEVCPCEIHKSRIWEIALSAIAYLSGDFCKRWCSSCSKNFSTCFLNSKIFANSN